MDACTPGTVGGWRLLRGAVVGSAATALAVGAHCLAGSRPPAWTSVVCLAVLLGTVSTRLSGVRWTFPRLMLLLLAAEAGMHAVFGATQPMAHSTEHTHLAEPAAAHASMLLPTGPTMVAGHLVAAVATALLLRRGEAWLGGVLDALALRVLRLLDATLPMYGGPQPVPVHVPDLPRQSSAVGARRQRGPPR